MLEKYQIIKTNNTDILYLFLNVNYEFANEFTNESLKEKATNYLKNYDIDFKGNKIIFVINGITTKSINLNDYNIFKDDQLITLSNDDKLTVTELLLSFLFANISINLRKETLKAICVLYRDEIIRNLTNNYLDLTKLSLSYHNYNYFKLTYPETFKSHFKIFNAAIKETEGEYLIYDNKPIKCLMHLVSNGYTEEDDNIPYTIKKESLWDLTYPNYLQQKSYSIKEFKKRLNLTDNNYHLKIESISNSNRIKEINLGGRIIEAKTLTVYLNLPSTDITIIIKKDYLTFVTRGIGSGLGLSIIGADNLAELGYNYKQILNYYFKDVSLVVPKQNHD